MPNKVVRVMRSIFFITVFCAGCSTLNILKGQDDFCQFMLADLSSGMEEAISRELSKEPPDGALTKPYSREEWDKYWNHRIYYVWDVGPNDCGGTYKGPSGPELIREAIKKRQEVGLPEVNLEPRNTDKQL